MVTLAFCHIVAAQAHYVEFHEDRGGGGKTCKDYHLWAQNKGKGCLAVVGNDEIAHVKVCGNRCVEMWDKDSWQGKYWKVCSTTSSAGICASQDAGDGKVSSYKITPHDYCDDGRNPMCEDFCIVTLCEHNNKQGRCCAKGLGHYNIDTFTGTCPRNDQLSYIQINGSCRVYLWQHHNFQGNRYDLFGPGSWNQGSGSFPNDEISSFKIYSHRRRLEVGENKTNMRRLEAGENKTNISVSAAD